MIDRLPPQSLDSEQAVLGSILIDRDAIIEVAEFLHPEDFYRQAHGRIFAAMLELFERREPVDIVTVAEALERDDELEAIGGASYLSTLWQRHAYRRPRRPVRANRRAQGGSAEPDPRRRQDRRQSATRTVRTSRRRSTASEAELFAVSQHRIDAGFSPLRTLLHDAYDRLDYLHAHRGEISGIPSGFADLDR